MYVQAGPHVWEGVAVPTERCGKAGNSYDTARRVGMLGNCSEPSEFKLFIGFSLRSHRKAFVECDAVLESATYVYFPLAKGPGDSNMANQPMLGVWINTKYFQVSC